MKKLAVTLFLSLLVLSFFAGGYAAAGSEEDAVKKVIEEAYVKGIHINRDIPAIKKGFHTEFNMLIFRDNNISRYPISKWINAIEKRKEENPSPQKYFSFKKGKVPEGQNQGQSNNPPKSTHTDKKPG